ncbi:MAG: AAA family ATPase [Chloroflexi bacterium]|nr:AAA family ATPase [Chloroflexota bacterium]
MPASQVLLLDHDRASAELISSVVTGAGEQVVLVENAAAALDAAGQADLVILGLVRGGPSALEICRGIRASPAAGETPLLCICQTDDVEERIGFLEAGADDVIARPFDGRELEARVEALLVRVRGSEALRPEPPAPQAPAARVGDLTVVFSPKGGVGTTTVAVNLAVALAESRPGRVALIDMDLQWGQAATYLNLAARHTVSELARDEQALADPETLITYVRSHSAGVAVLPAPARADEVELVDPERVRRVLDAMAAAYEVLVVDAGSTLDERTLALFEAAQRIIVPLTPDIAALKTFQSLREILAEAGGLEGKMVLVLNHLWARDLLSLADVETSLDAKVAVELPHDPVLYAKASNEGTPIVRGSPKSRPAERLRELASKVSTPVPVGDSDGEQLRRGRLGGLLRRS